MPQIHMPAKEPEPEPVKEQITERNEPNDKQLIQSIQDEMMDDLPSDNDEIIEVTERNIPTEDEVFDEPTPKVKPIVQEEPEEEPVTEFSQPKGKRKYTRKAPMSDKQKAHLEKIRKISLEKRAQKKLEKEEDKKRKEEEKEKARILKAQERLLAKQKKEQEQTENRRFNNEIKQPEQRPQALFTQEDMQNAMYSAIASYDAVRKKEKAEKKQRELAEAREAQMRRTLEQAIRPQPPPDPWRALFS